MWVPLKGKEKNKKDEKQTDEKIDRGVERVHFIFFFSLSFLFQIYENLTVGFHRDKHEKCSTRRGLRVGTKNTGFQREFR